MGALLDEFKLELLKRQGTPGFDQEAFKTEFLESRGRKSKAAESVSEGRGLPPAESRGLVADVASASIGGLSRGAENWIRNIRNFDPEGGNDVIRDYATKGIKGIEGFLNKHPFLRPSKEAESGFRRALTEGVSSFFQSAAAIVPGLPLGPIGGAAVGAAVFAGAEHDRVLEEVEQFIVNNKLTKTQAADLRKKGKSAAIKSAAVEGGFELAANTLTAMTLGLFKPFKGAAKGAAKSTFKSLFEQPGSALIRGGKAYAKTALSEVSTETAQEALETKFRRDIGITDMSSLDAAMSVIGPTLVTSALFLGSTSTLNKIQRNNIKKGLQDAIDPATGLATDPKKRKKAVDSAVDAIFGVKPKKENAERKESLRQGAYGYIDSGASIDLNTDFGVIDFVGRMTKDLHSGAMKIDDFQKFGEGIQTENPAVSNEILRVANSFRILNGIPDIGQTAPPGTEQDLADVMLDETQDVSLEDVVAETDDVKDSPTVTTEKEVSDEEIDATVGEPETIQSGFKVGATRVEEMTDDQLTEELVIHRQTQFDQDPRLKDIQAERVNLIIAEQKDRQETGRRGPVIEEEPVTTERPPVVTEEEPVTTERPPVVTESTEKTKAATEEFFVPKEGKFQKIEAEPVLKEQGDFFIHEEDGRFFVREAESGIEVGFAQKREDAIANAATTIARPDFQGLKQKAIEEGGRSPRFGGPEEITTKLPKAELKPGELNFEQENEIRGLRQEIRRADNANDEPARLAAVAKFEAFLERENIPDPRTGEIVAVEEERRKSVIEKPIKKEPPVTKEPPVSVTQKEILITSTEEIDALIDAIQPETKEKRPVSVTEKAKGVKPRATTKELKEKTAVSILADAGKAGVKGIDEALKGMFELFGGASLKTLPGSVNKETYEKAKPHFQKALTEFGKAGKSLKEFIQFAVNNFGNGIKPYLKQFIVEQKAALEVAPEAPKEKPVVKEKPKDVGEPKAKKKTKEKKSEPVKPKRIKMKDVGERVPGKRSQKNNLERIKEDLKELETGNTNKDLNKILNRATPRSKVWDIDPKNRPNATPGLIRYLTMIRDFAQGVTAHTAERVGGGFTGTSKAHLESFAEIEGVPGDRKGYNQIVEEVARYEHALNMLNAATATASTVQEAHDNIIELIVDPEKWEEQKKTAKSLGSAARPANAMGFLSPEGEAIMNIFEWAKARAIFRNAAMFIEREQEVVPEKKQLRRTRVALSEMERENLPDHRKEVPNPTPEQFIKKFGFRATEFGEYVDSVSGRRHLNLAWDSFHDLAQALGIPIKSASVVAGNSGFMEGTGESPKGGQITEGTHLAMAFGSRGRGRHAAHYEPSNHLINMTRDSGDGALSHEWGHALDGALSLTESGRAAVRDVTEALNIKYDLERAKAEVEEILTGNSRWTRGRIGRTPVETAKQFLQSQWRRYVEVPTKFTQNARELGEYWDKNKEKFARAFEAFIYDTLPGSSPYLVSDWASGVVTTTENGYRLNPYPQGEERENFNRIFKHFTDGIEWSEDGVPKMKADYELVTEKERRSAQEALNKIIDKLEEMFAAMHQGKASKDGLWWYQYTITKRGNLMQPKGINAYDDKIGENGAVGYTEALLPDDILYYKLKSITHDEDANKVYLKEKEDAEDLEPRDVLDTAGLEGEASLGEISPEDGEGVETGTGVPRRPVERPREITDRPSEPGTSGPASAFGDGSSASDVDTFAGGDIRTQLESGQDAVLSGGNYRITESDRVGQGTLNEKFSNNIAAIRTLKAIEKEGRLATREEQAILVKYVGWGGMSKVFDRWAGEGWSDKFEIVEQTLSEEEITGARASTLSAFYTSPEIVRSIYKALQKFGFTEGRILEPAVGTGNFFGMLPETLMQATQLVGVEMDSISARIAKQLYQRASIFHSPYEKAVLPRNFYDVALSNVPFEEVIPFDRTFNKKRLKVHDYYFNKSLEMVRPGGIVGFITSAGTMDKVNEEARKLIDKKAEFVGAIRLPDTAFKDAGTKVTADIIFLRRRGGEGAEVPAQKWTKITNWTQVEPEKADEAYSINEYFANNPDMMLGQMAKTGRWDNSQSLISDGRNIEEAITEAIDKLPADIYKKPKAVVEVDIAELIPNPEDLIDGSFFEQEGKLFIHVTGEPAVEYEEKTQHQKRKGKVIREFIKIRGARRAMLKAQAREESEEVQKTLTEKLNKVYDGFVKKFGFLNVAENLRAFIDDPEAPRILALENWNDELQEATKSDIFSKKFIENLRPITSVDAPKDALPHSLNQLGRVDIPFIARLSGVTEDEAIAELQGEIWNDPEAGWVTADEYLSGNIKAKIALAKQAAKSDPIYKKNIEALTPLIPEDLPPSKIRANLGAPWIEPKDVQAFIRELIPGSHDIHVDYVPEIGLWRLTPKNRWSDAEAKRNYKSLKGSVAATATWGTSRKDFFELVEKFILNGSAQGLKVEDKVPGEGGGKILNVVETEAAQAKLEAIKEKFSKWLWQDDTRLTKYVRKYNDVYNATRPRKYNGDHLTFPGKVPNDIITLTKHQKNAVWRAITTGFNAYFAHEVGTGKTFAMAATIMEAKRLGLKKKPLLLGIKTNVDALAEDFVKLYPTARILRMDVSGNALKRKIQLNRIANNEWDAVIITHDSFKNIQLSAEGQSEAMDEEIGNLRLSLALAQESGAARFTVKAIEKKIKALVVELERLQASLEKGKIGLDFEELGVDMIVVDEAHMFKNIPYPTKLEGIVGVSGEGSGKAFDLHMKTRWLHEKYGGGIIMASGTPITNSVSEIYNISRYLNPQTLRDKGIHTFDAWAAAFGNITQAAEFAPEGGGYRMVRKFKEFFNIPELRAIVKEVVDVATVNDLELKVPEILNGKPIPVVVPQNDMIEALSQELLIRAKDIRRGGVNKQPRHPDKTDIMFSIISDGRNGAIDMRLVDPLLPDHPDTKVNYAVKRIFQTYKQSQSIKGTQLVFADRGVPGKGKHKKPFDVHNDIKNKLVAMGIPANEIAFPRDVKTNRLKKKKLFNQVSSGDVRVLIGSTADMGIGVNVQERGVAIHNLDTEWTFEKLEQRRGRFVRQGNMLYNLGLPVAVFNYMTEKTVDAFMWDKVANKKITTEVVLFGESEAREVEDVSQESVSAQEMMAFASGDSRFLRKVELEAEVRKLNAVRGNWVDEQYRLKRDLQGIPGIIDAMNDGINHRREGQEFFEEVNAVKIGDVLYDLKRHSKEINEKMAQVLNPKNVERVHKSDSKIPIATYLNAITEEIESEEEVTTVKTVKGEKVEVKERQKKMNKVLRENGNNISVYVRRQLVLGERKKGTLEDLKLGTKTKYGEYEMTASGGLARLLANTKSAMERESKESRETITKKLAEKEAIEAEIAKPFEQEKEHTAKTLELETLTRELSQLLQEQQEEQRRIDPDLERFKSQAKDVTNLDDSFIKKEDDQHKKDIKFSLKEISTIKDLEREYYGVVEELGRVVADKDTEGKERIESRLRAVEERLAKANKINKTPLRGTTKPGSVINAVFNDLFEEAENILGTGKTKFEVKTTEEIASEVRDEFESLGESIEEAHRIKGLYRGENLYGISARDIIALSMDGISSLPDMKATTRHEVFHGVFNRLLNKEDRKIILNRYGDEEKASDAFARYLANREAKIDANVKGIFERLIDFFNSLANKIRGRGFRSAGDIFGEAAAGNLIKRRSVNRSAGVNVAFKIEEGVSEEEIIEAHTSDRADYQKLLKSEDGLTRQYAEALRNVVTQNPQNVLGNHDRSALVNEIYSGTTNKDIKFFQRVFGLPWFLAKKFKEWKSALGIELKRSEERNLLITEFQKKQGRLQPGEKDQHEIMALKANEEEGVLLVIYEGDARNKQFTDEELATGLELETLGELDVKYKGKKVTLSRKQIDAYKAWQSSMEKMRDKTLEAIDKLTYMSYEGKPWIEKLKAVIKNHELQRARQKTVEGDSPTPFTELRDSEIPPRMKEADKKEFIDAFNKILPKQIRIATLRRQMGKIEGYAPRVREGKFVVKATTPDGDVLWSERTEKEKETKGMIESMMKRFESQGFSHGTDFVIRKEISDKASEFIFDQVQAVSVERFVNKALAQAKTKDKISEADINAVTEEMVIALTNEFKQRGFPAHMMKRRKGFPIGGYKIEKIKKRFASYVSGGSGYITKQVAAFEYANLLRTIDINTKPDLYEDIARYSGDMLRNSTRIDRISGRVRTGAFIWYLAGQLKSPVVNFTQNWILGIPLLEKAMGRGAKGLYHKAMADVARRKYTEQEKRFITEMRDRGITGDQLTQEITGQTISEAGQGLNRVIKVLAAPFSLSEIYNRKVSGLARFRAAIAAGDTYQEAFNKSRDFIIDVHFLYGKLNAPSGARGGTPGAAILRTSLTFRNYTFNFLHAMKDMLSAKDFRTIAKSMTYMALLGGASALPFLDGFLDMLERITGIPWRKNAKKELENVGGEVLANVGVQGLPALLGADIGGSLRIHFPDVTDPGKLIEESVFGVYEGLALKAANSIRAASTGQYARAFEMASPTFIERPMKARRQAEEGLTTTRGKIIKGPTGEQVIPTIGETIATGLGFRPARLARLSDTYRQYGNFEKFYLDWRSSIYTKFRLASTFEARQIVIQEVIEYNKEAMAQKGAVSLIKAAQLKNALKERKDKRYAIFGG